LIVPVLFGLERAEHVRGCGCSQSGVSPRSSSGRPLANQVTSESFEAEAHVAFDGPDWYVEHRRDLAVGEAAEIGELDHLELFDRQALER
jgi:hypothetical protein